MDNTALDKAIFKVKDFPRKGVLFYDITGILINPEIFRMVINEYTQRYANKKPKAIAAIDSRGFIFAAPVAYILRLPMILVRKGGKLPRTTITQSFSLEYGTDTIELNPEDVPRGKVVLFDDLLATGGTARASCNLLEKCGAEIQEIASVIALDFLPYAKALHKYPYHYLISYSTETY